MSSPQQWGKNNASCINEYRLGVAFHFDLFNIAYLYV